MSKSTFQGEILSFDPFRAEFINYYGRHASVTFTCPNCGGHSVKRCIGSEADGYLFFSGHFRCLTCCKGSYLGKPFNYASPAFILVIDPIVEQLSLF